MKSCRGAQIPWGFVSLQLNTASGARTASGTSSFGMSGINAHALLATPSDAHLEDGPHSIWQRTQCLPAPSAHPLLERVSGSAHNRSMMIFSVNIAAAGLAFLADHRHVVSYACAHVRRIASKLSGSALHCTAGSRAGR